MVIGLLMGAETNVDIYRSTQLNYQLSTQSTYAPTITFSPQRTLAYSMQYSPQLIINSPYATSGFGGSANPSMIPQVTVIPSIAQKTDQGTAQTATADQAEAGGSMMENFIAIGAVAVAGLIAWQFLKKKKGGVKNPKR